MAFQKRLDCVSNGYQMPAMPRVPRSAKGKRSARKKIEDNQMCAFDLLATLAGKLLEEKEGLWAPSNTAGVTSTVYSNIQEQQDNESPFKVGAFDQGSCDESTFGFPHVPYDQISHTTKQHLKNLEARAAAYAPDALVKSDASENDASCKVFASGARGGEFPCKFLCSTSGPLMYDDSKSICNLEDRNDLDRKHPVIVSSDSSIEIPPYGDCRKTRSSSFPLNREGMERLRYRDDGENSSGCTHPRYIHPKAFKAHCTEDHRRRKMMKSTYRKVDPVSYSDGELSNDDVKMKPVFGSQRFFYTRQKSQRSSLKRRKLFDRCSVSPSCGSSRDEVMLDSPVKDVNRLDAASDLLAALNGANNMSCTQKGENSFYESEDHPVKLSIKSFKVPELFIEIPANATVGSLKRTVMEAVMTILGDGLRVGVLLQGKKVRDDNKTLHQAGISYEDKIDSLGFTLEPTITRTPPPRHSLKEPTLIPYDPQPLNKFQDKGTSDSTFWPPPIPIPTTNCIDSDHENSVHSPIGQPSLPYKIASDSKALVPVPAVNPEALSILPIRKSRRSDIAQRRIRRPFSVSEVEALVQAVEKLGTGRWRDVKLRAFDNSKHRTYVDLKDKWKTLVHTARISPQQRRGEPVPQELLDRVLLAHSYWAEKQAHLPGPAESCLAV